MQPISRPELSAKLAEGKVDALVEVLPQNSFDEFHLPGVINVPVGDDDFPDRIQDAVPEKDETVVFYCHDTECPASAKAAEKMEALGYTDVFDYEAGKMDWKEAGLQVVSS